jgi:MAE_28990/MAE_18760-like HEPN
MFSSLTRQLRVEIARVESVVTTSERLRSLLFDSAAVLPSNPPQPDETARGELAPKVRGFLGSGTPNRVDWQIYDHCAAFTRLYAAYEQFVNELIANYIRLLPNLYKAYDDLPEKLILHHRTGIAQILIKIGPKKQYREVEEKTLIAALSSGLREGTPFSLIPEAFFVDRQNYRFEVLVNILASLGLENTGASIIRHSLLVDFMKSVRGDSSTPQGELESFVKYRNEATHGTVENIVSVDELRKVGQFVGILGDVLAQIIESTVLRRRVSVGQSRIIGVVQESFRQGYVVVAKMSETELAVGDEIILYGRRICKKTRVLEIQVADIGQPRVKTIDGQEVGIRLSDNAQTRMELHRLAPDQVVGGELQLRLEESPLEALEDADLDVPQPKDSAQEAQAPETVLPESEESTS